MDTIIWLATWTMTGLWSFIATQYIVDGWDYVRSQPDPHHFYISAMFTGPVTTLVCLYTIYKYYTTRK